MSGGGQGWVSCDNRSDKNSRIRRDQAVMHFWYVRNLVEELELGPAKI